MKFHITRASKKESECHALHGPARTYGDIRVENVEPGGVLVGVRSRKSNAFPVFQLAHSLMTACLAQDLPNASVDPVVDIVRLITVLTGT